MSHVDPSGTPVQPTLADLLARHLQRQAQAQAAGLLAEGAAEVVPFETAPVQPVDPRLAWDGARAALGFVRSELPDLAPPSDWASLVSTREPVLALPCCLGNFPQLVRSLYPLLHEPDLTALRPTASRATGSATPFAWAGDQIATGRAPEMLLAAGVLRLAQEFDRVAELLANWRDTVSAEWRGAWANEEAALAWHRGQAEEAAALWQVQEPTVPVLFNRGMSALFLGRTALARKWLAEAVRQVPEDEPWQHLGQLYLALAELRGG
jgi:hypothetical protein